jgi:RNA-directed DNA polymerase
LQALEPVAETRAEPHSYGFRPARACADALGPCPKLLSRTGAPEWILEADVQACFDQIDHQWLWDHIPLERSLLRKWLTAGYLAHSDWFPTQAGTPQGGIVSPVLANLALDGVQERLTQAFPPLPRRQGGLLPQVHLVRSADDFVITGRSRAQWEPEVVPLVQDFLAERGLTLAPEKTHIPHVTDGFDFLGQNVRRYGRKTLRKPSDRAIPTF